MTLTTVAQFQDDATLSEYLSDELREGRLALVLGAGISYYFKLPSWDVLADDCCRAKGITVPSPRPDNRDLAEEVRVSCAGNNADYLNIVQSNLYKNVSIRMEDLRKNDTLAAIGSLVMSSIRGSVTNVITYNFDDLLELFLHYHGFKTQVVSDLPAWGQSSDVRILHPHGFLPSNSALKRTDWIIFDRSSYSNRAAIEQLWKEEQLPILRQHTCLFIGLSNRDDEVDTLLSHIKDNHPCSHTGTPFWGVRFAVSSGDPARDTREVRKMADRGLHLKFVKDYDTDLPKFLFSICQRAAGVVL